MKLFLSLLNVILVLSACSPNDSHAILGVLERDRIEVSAMVNERIVSIAVKERQQVQQGQVLMQLNAEDAEARLNQALAEESLAQARLQELRNGARVEEVEVLKAKLKGAEAALHNALLQLGRAQKLRLEKAIGEATIDQARASYDSALAERNAQQKQLQLALNGTRIEQLLQAEAQLSIAQSNIAIAKKHLQNYTLVAPENALVDDIPWQEGEVLNSGVSAVILLAQRPPFARVYVPQNIKAKIRINDTLDVHVEGYSESFKGRVSRLQVDPAFTPFFALNQKERARLVYLAEIELLENNNNLPAGLSVEVTVP